MDKPTPEMPSEERGAARKRRPSMRRLADDGAADTRASDTLANVRHAGAVMLIAFALMTLFNSDSLSSYTRDLPDGWFADAAIVGADQWHELMLALGPAHAKPAVRQLFERAHTVQW